MPPEYAGEWVCQSAIPGYNLPLPAARGSAPSTGRMTTPPSTAVVKFTLNTGGTYEAQNANGHYSFEPTTKTIVWLDGLYRQQFSKTEISRRSDGAPSLHFTANERYFGCFMARESTLSTTGAVPEGRRYTKEQVLALRREGDQAFTRRDFITARRIFEDLVRDDPNSASAHASLGALMLTIGETPGSLVHLSRAIELNSRETRAYVDRGQAYLRVGRRQEGEADLKKAISLDPSDKDPAVNRARALLSGQMRP